MILLLVNNITLTVQGMERAGKTEGMSELVLMYIFVILSKNTYQKVHKC